MTIREKRELAEMIGELEAGKLEVVLIPAPSPRHCGHMVRAVVNRPPSWYRAICNRYASGRFRAKSKFDTKIKRKNILALLYATFEGKKSKSAYLPDILHVIKNRLEKRKNVLQVCEDPF